MALRVIDKDILTVSVGVICHQVNCQGVMERGIALSIKNKWPIVHTQYQQFCKDHPLPLNRWGHIDVIRVGAGLHVANIFGQMDYGTEKRCYTDYSAVMLAFMDLRELLKKESYQYARQVYIPYMMGCGLAGGNWDSYQAVTADIIPNVIICKLPSPKGL